MVADRFQVFQPASQGRQDDLNRINPVKQIVPERALISQLVDVLIGSRYQADVNGSGPGTSHPVYLPGLQRIQ